MTLPEKRHTPKETADILGYKHVSSVYNHINAGNLKYIKIGPRRMLITDEAIEQFLKKWNNEG